MSSPAPPVGRGTVTEPGSQLSAERDASSRLISAGAVMAAGTLVSRILGFGRLMLLVFLLGNGTRQADMFILANTVPNSMYILLAGGVLNTVLVPQIVRAIKTDPDGGAAYTNRIMTAGLIVLGVVTVLLTLAVPLIVGLYSAAAWKTPALAGQYDSMVMLGYYCMPQVFFFGVHVLAGQILNARDRFGPMMWAPIANNVVSIGVLTIFAVVFGRGDTGQPFSTGQELLLGLGSTLGIAMQAAVLVPFLRAAGFRFHPRFDFARTAPDSTSLEHTLRLAKWTLGFVLVTQAGLVVISRLASGAAVGGSGAGLLVYQNAHAVWILPHSLITVSLATAMLPSASRLAATGDLSAVAAETTRTVRLAVTALLPAAVAFAILGLPIAEFLFGFGRGGEDAYFVGWALMAFALGLVPFTVQYICLRTYYALEDTRSTFFLQLLITGANVGLAMLIVALVDRPALVATGLAVAYSLAYCLGVGVSFGFLARRLPGLDGRPLLRHCVRLFVAALPAGVVAWGICWSFARWSDHQGVRLLALVTAGVVAVTLFLVLARALRITEVGEIVRTLTRRRSGVAGSNSDAVRSGDSAGSGGADAPTIRSAPATSTGPGLAQPEPTGTHENADTMVIYAGPHPRTAADPSPPSSPGPDASGSDTATLTGPPLSPVSAVLGEDTVRTAPTLHAGAVLANRYRLEELRSEAAPTIIWRAFDQVLSRSVLVHLLPPGDPRTEDLLTAARRAAVATDSRFLRVLDAVQSEDPRLGSYVVSEYATGQSLQTVLSHGPLSGLEAAWVVREIADALSSVHALGIHHERISPASVVITPAGNIKILGLLIDAAVRPGASLQGTDLTGDPARAEVIDLGRLLYACLVARWPGGPAYDLPDAPHLGRHWATPRQVRAGVSPALDHLCDQILSDPPRHRAEQIVTVHGLVTALSKVLGSADASGDLERRLRQPIPTVPAEVFADEPTQTFAAVTHESVGPTVRVAAVSPGPQPTATARALGTTGQGTTGAPRKPASGATPVTRRTPRRWIALLAALVVLLLTAGVVATVVSNRDPGRVGVAEQPSAPASSGVPSAPQTIARVLEFDPQGDPRTENPDEVPNAVDGDSDTRWRTVQYRNNPELGGLKRGVGLVLDLGTTSTVAGVRVSLSGQGTDVEVRVPKEADVSKAPLDSDNQWRTVSSQDGARQTTALRFAEAENTRFVLVYLTSLPKEGNGYRGGIVELEVF